MLSTKRQGVTRFGIALGLATLAAIGLFALPQVWRGTDQERSERAASGAETIARAVLEYRCDTGDWPARGEKGLELECLTGTGRVGQASLMGTAADLNRDRSAGSARWLNEVPLDPWGRPYRVYLMGETGTVTVAVDEAGYPSAPPAGLDIIVLSSGPDGLVQTTSPLNFRGDDIGFIMEGTASGRDPAGGDR